MILLKTDALSLTAIWEVSATRHVNVNVVKMSTQARFRLTLLVLIYFPEDIKKHLYFQSPLNTEMAQVVQILRMKYKNLFTVHINAMAVDGLAMQGARPSAAVVVS